MKRWLHSLTQPERRARLGPDARTKSARAAPTRAPIIALENNQRRRHGVQSTPLPTLHVISS